MRNLPTESGFPRVAVVLALILGFAVALPRGNLAAQQIADSTAARRATALAADTIAAWLRADGRTHLYVASEVRCPASVVCAQPQMEAARGAFASAVIATVVTPAQRWPTLCDNSDLISLEMPVVYEDSAWMSLTASRPERGAPGTAVTQHRVVLSRVSTGWKVVSHDTATVPVDSRSGVAPGICAWSPEPGSASPVGVAPAASARPVPVTRISAIESCVSCRLELGNPKRLLHPFDTIPTAEPPQIFTSGRGRFYLPSLDRTQVIEFDSAGAVDGVAGSAGDAPGQFASVDRVVIDANDSLFVLDNSLRRISVFSPQNSYVRHMMMPREVRDFRILRDGRLLVLWDARRSEDPLSVISATGDVIRSFGARGADMAATVCDGCTSPLMALAPSGYRVWLAWSDRYQLEEWDLAGRRMRVIEGPSRPLQIDPVRVAQLRDAQDDAPGRTPGLRHIVAARDGTLWVSLTAIDAARTPVRILDVIDPGRSQLLRSTRGESLELSLFEGVRLVWQDALTREAYLQSYRLVRGGERE